ncbi:MAG: PucR family transcriptional regulator ligand-binding domain-containing protein [Lachnospiraceae bacterium]
MFRCKDLYQLETLQQISCLTGDVGLEHRIRWAYVAETVSIMNWVKGGELLIVSGAVINQPKFNLEMLILESINKGLAGALILKGKNYVMHISDEVVLLAKEHGFPLFSIPWDIPLVNILEEIGRSIVGNNRLEEAETALVSDLLFNSNFEKEYIINYDFMKEIQSSYYQVILVNSYGVEQKQTMEETVLYNVREVCLDVLEQQKVQVLSMIYKRGVVLILGWNEDEAYTHRKSIIEKCNLSLRKKYHKLHFKIGVGKEKSDQKKIKDSFHEALGSIKISGLLGEEKQVNYFEELGFYGLLLELEQEEVLRKYSIHILNPILEYDQMNNGILVETLKAYFQCNGNLYRSSEKIYVHVNTLKYRLKKISELTNLSMENEKSRLDLHTAVIIKEFLER